MKIIKIILTALFFCLVFVLGVNAQSDNSATGQEEKSLEIIKKPSVDMNAVTSCRKSSGTAKLKVTFDRSAKVTNVELISSSGCNKFDKGAIKAAAKIKFKPALKNGEPITITKTVIYDYKLYNREN